MQIIASFPKVYNDFIAAKKQHKSFRKNVFRNISLLLIVMNKKN